MIVAMMTVSDIVQELGGNAATAALFGVGVTAVSNWKAANAFPERHHFRIWRLCQERGLDWTPPESDPATPSSRDYGRPASTGSGRPVFHGSSET